MVSREGTRTCPEKVKAIQNFPAPKNIFEVRSFLGLASYYGCFIKDFASIARPISNILKGENGKVSTFRSKNIPIAFSNDQLQAFEKIKSILASESVILHYPDFSQPFDLTTDASSTGICAVLLQNSRPITMISRTLKDAEVNYASNERELFAIVWALDTLRYYLYGKSDINIFTDPVSDRNPNSKIKRWKARIDETRARVFYKPGKENFVADALSRQNLHALQSSNASDAATVHSELSSTYAIKSSDKPINCFRNQMIRQGAFPSRQLFIIFGQKTRHHIDFEDWNTLIDTVKSVVKPDVTNAIFFELPVLARIQHPLVMAFPATAFWHCKRFVADVTNKEEQVEIVTVEHNHIEPHKRT